MARSPDILNLAMEAWIMANVARARAIARESSSNLKRTAAPDTFLGRKTYDPFPPEQEATD
jgi:hypothetical protein